MANPQVERGYTRIANELLKQIIKTNFNGTQLKIVLAIFRYTYGFQRKEYELSLAKLSEALDTRKSHVDKELTALIDRNIIIVHGVGPRRGRILSCNKNYDEWDQVKVVEPPKEPEKKKKAKPKKKYDEDNTYYKMSLYFFDRVSKVAEEAGVKHLVAKANLQKWADDFRLLVEKDGVDKRLAKDVMDWVTEDSFWKTNVLSAKKLREKFGELAIKMAAKKKPSPSMSMQAPRKDVRDKDIEFQRFIAAGGDPSDFDWGK